MSSRRPTIVYGDAPSSHSSSSHYRTSSRDSHDSGYLSGGGYNQTNYHDGQAQSYSQSYSTREPTTPYSSEGRGGYNQYHYHTGNDAANYSTQLSKTTGTSSSKPSKSKATYHTVVKSPYGSSRYPDSTGPSDASYDYKKVTRTKPNGKTTTVINYGTSSSDYYGGR
ncbi:MAG: hypothetical protein M1838_003945 [Thelocarpon superellum]|nr:MAG: hypothetical protein M1838_003945 [Thelocarpon superellum]